MEVCLRRSSPDSMGGSLWWRICSDPVFVRICSCVFRRVPVDLCYSSTTAVVVVVCWFIGVLARRLPDCLLQQVVSDSGDGRAMTAARLRLASVLVVVASFFLKK